MLEQIIEDSEFASLMQKNLEELIIHFFAKEHNFGILCKIEDVHFEPALPKDINSEFRPLTLFFLAGYTFETAHISNGMLIFEAGFGAENFGSIVSVPILSIMQVIIDETPVLINLASHKSKKEEVAVDNDNGLENSMNSFLSNPENSKFLKK